MSTVPLQEGLSFLQVPASVTYVYENDPSQPTFNADFANLFQGLAAIPAAVTAMGGATVALTPLGSLQFIDPNGTSVAIFSPGTARNNFIISLFQALVALSNRDIDALLTAHHVQLVAAGVTVFPRV